MRKTLLILTAVICSATARADYPSARPNHNIREELLGDNDRLIPTFDHFVFAADGDAWFRALGTKDFYHGGGYWMQFRSEINPNPHFTINARSIFYSGSSSQGYANPTGFYNLIGLTGVWPEKVFGSQIKMRIVDLERQTVGEGLIIQDREMNGGHLQIGNDFYEFSVLIDSTGALVSIYDTYNVQLTLLNGLLGLGAVQWVEDGSGETMPEPYYYFTSHYSWNQNLRSGIEAGQRGSSFAGMADVSYNKNIGGLSVKSKIEYRNYTPGVDDVFGGQVQQQYVSYDQYDKPYTSPMNIFTVDDNAQVYALQLNLKYIFNRAWQIEALNEVGEFDYAHTTANSYYFYRVALTHRPLADRDDNISIVSSNKVLADSYERPPRDYSTGDKPLFVEYPYFAIEANFRF